MAKKSKKISQLSGLGEKPNLEDIIPLTHVEDKTGSQEGTTRKVTVENLMKSAPIQSINGQTGDVLIESLKGDAGIQGPIGPKGEPGPIGPAGLNWKGMWSSSKNYIEDDAVGHLGASYFCIQDVGSGQADPSTNSTNWALMASQGARGQDGAEGPQGSPGPKGDAGDIGPAGADGAEGPQGSTGPKGDTGPAGADGVGTGYATKVGHNPANESDTASIVLDPGNSTTPATYKGNVINDNGNVVFDASTGEVNGQVSDISNHGIDGLSDVQTSSVDHVPSDGDFLVWNESHNHWMPGQGQQSSGSTALPDGGAGSNSLMRSRSDFEGVLPDSIMVNYSSYTMQLYLRLTYRDSDGGGIEYMGPYNEYVSFYNNPTGNGLRYKDENISFEDNATSIQQVIDSGNAIYNGQRSGTSGAGGLTMIKEASNFAGTVPDAIVMSFTGGGTGVFMLYHINPNYIYFCDLVRYYSFDNSPQGGYHQSSDSAVLNDYDNLQGYIDNNRALYYGEQEFSIKAWGTFDGTAGDGAKTFTGGNIDSIVKTSTNGIILYKVTFINPMPHANYSVSGSSNPNNYSGAYFGVRQHDNPVTATDFHIELRTAANAFSSSDRISFQVVC